MAHSVDNSKQLNDLDMTGQSVLVQSELGIFYGTLEKADTRNGTALLRNGFMISPDRHITFSQYLDFLAAEANEISEAFYEDFDEEGQPTNDPSELELPSEIQLTMDDFKEHSQHLTISDYAVGGIYLVQFRTSTYWNTNYRQSVARLISLTNISAIVPVNIGKGYVIEHEEFDVARYGEKDDHSVFPLENLFKESLENVAITPEDTFRYMILHTTPGILGSLIDNVNNGKGGEQLPEDFLNPIGLAENKKLPKLVVNTKQRVEHFKALKKAQDNEQSK